MKRLLFIYGVMVVISLGIIVLGVMLLNATLGSISYTNASNPSLTLKQSTEKIEVPKTPAWPASLDTTEYDKRLLALSKYRAPESIITASTSIDHSGVATTTTTTTPSNLLEHEAGMNVTVSGLRWPVAAPYPHGGAVLPFKRILAYYGNFYSTRMGILGEYDEDTVLRKLRETKAEWEVADPTTPVLPAIEYIAMVAQGDSGADGMYRAVMPDSEIEKGYEMAQKIGGVYILDIQIGLSPLEKELPKFKKFLERPDVFFAIDPEFSMKTGERPGTVIGTVSAEDINYAIRYLSDIVKEKKLPPKVLIVHRFTDKMVTGAQKIVPTNEVQVVINMDGWGSKDLKRGTYSRVIEPEPVQFSGIKLFYKNDLKPPSTGLLTPEEVLKLKPSPIYIQYQ